MRRMSLLAACLASVTLTACAAGPGPAGEPARLAPAGAPSQAGASPLAAAPVTVLKPTTVAVPDRLAAAPFDVPRRLMAPAGWHVSVYARVQGARQLAFGPDGRLLVSQPGAGRVVALTRGADGVTSSEVLLEGLRQPHGLAFAGATLFVAESNRVDAYNYTGGRATGRATVVDGLPDGSTPELRGAYAHALKSVAVGADGALYVSVGSTGNTSAQDRDASPERAVVLRVPAGTLGLEARDAEVFARGVRNGTALAVAPDGQVWAAVNNRDNIAYPFRRAYDATADGAGRDDVGTVIPDYVDDHPMEPFARLTAGRDLGWPYCNPDPDVDPGVKGSALSYARPPFVRDAQQNPDGGRLDCSALPRIEQGLPAHSAPLGLSFADVPGYGTGALVGVHGSWNRKPPRAPNVSFFGYAGGTMSGQQVLLSGWQSADGARWGRPVAALMGPDGVLYVSDDASGTIYRVTPAV